MELTRHPDATRFLAAVRPELEPHEAQHNVLLGLTLGLVGTPLPEGQEAGMWTVRDGEGLALAALRLPSRPLVLASPREDVRPAVECLVQHLVGAGMALSAVDAAAALAGCFSTAWAHASGQPSREAMRMRLYRLTEVQRVHSAPGALRQAAAADVELVARWMLAFEQEALGKGSEAWARASAERRIAAGEVFLWENGEVRCMAASARPTWNGVAVNSVYTPPAERGRGYASTCTARLSEHLLRQGRRFCVLFTDLSNPTSNALYMRVGYRPLLDFRTIYMG